jgi:hypothetical protein
MQSFGNMRENHFLNSNFKKRQRFSNFKFPCFAHHVSILYYNNYRPDYTPFSLKCHTEDGKEYPIQTLIGTKGYNVNLEVKNIGPHSYPLTAACSYAIDPLSNAPNDVTSEKSIYVEGGAVKNISFGPEVDQLQVLMKTDGKQLKARIELLRGPNNIKQAFDVYSSNGDKNYLFLVFDMPGNTNAIRLKNLATLEYPLDFYYKASKIGDGEMPDMMWT